MEAEVTKIIEARQRRVHETDYRRRREGVKKHYEQLKSSGEQKVLPNLAQFRQLSIVNVLQSKASKTNIADAFKQSGLVAELLQSDLKKWQDSARAELATTLGFRDWKNLNKAKVHPVDRLTARFRCKVCGSESEAGRHMSFASACVHVCKRQKKAAKDNWSADQFEKDEQVLAVVHRRHYIFF